ncbi:MAG TPA: hypothetical protein VF676_02000 [Flavobacterium sp.]|jgi:hypothetical protein
MKYSTLILVLSMATSCKKKVSEDCCKPLFAIARDVALPSNWYDSNKELVCSTSDTHYHVRPADGDLRDRIAWNRKNQAYIDFERSKDYLISHHGQTRPQAQTYKYQDFTEDYIMHRLGADYRNTYDCFIRFYSNGTKTAKAERTEEFYEQPNVYSIPFIKALFSKYEGDLGVFVDPDDHSVHLKIGGQYFNISDDPGRFIGLTQCD